MKRKVEVLKEKAGREYYYCQITNKRLAEELCQKKQNEGKCNKYECGYRTAPIPPRVKIGKGPKIEKLKKEKKIPSGKMVKQKNYDGSEEILSADIYCNEIVCECGNIRYVKNADMFQVTRCKLCMAKTPTGKLMMKKLNLKKSSEINITK